MAGGGVSVLEHKIKDPDGVSDIDIYVATTHSVCHTVPNRQFAPKLYMTRFLILRSKYTGN